MNTRKKILSVIILLTLIFVYTPSADSKEKHEDVSPELLTAKKVCLTSRVNLDQEGDDHGSEREDRRGFERVAGRHPAGVAVSA